MKMAFGSETTTKLMRELKWRSHRCKQSYEKENMWRSLSKSLLQTSWSLNRVWWPIHGWRFKKKENGNEKALKKLRNVDLTMKLKINEMKAFVQFEFEMRWVTKLDTMCSKRKCMKCVIRLSRAGIVSSMHLSRLTIYRNCSLYAMHRRNKLNEIWKDSMHVNLINEF